MEDSTHQPKRKKLYTRSEILLKLDEHENNVKMAAEAIGEDLCPFDVNDEEAMAIEDRYERLDATTVKLAKKIRKVRNDLKDRNYRFQPEKMEETVISTSQYSLFQSDDSQSVGGSQDQHQEAARPLAYKLQPLNHSMAQRSRRRRVAETREMLEQAAMQQGVTVSELLGYLLHLENYMSEKSLAAIGWRIFCGENIFKKPDISLEEAIWMIETGGISQMVWQEFRLRLLERITLPPVQLVREENKLHRPDLEEYKHGVKAALVQCLQLTVTERLSQINLSGLNQESLQVAFKISWGLDGSGDHKNYHQLSKVGYTTKQVLHLLCNNDLKGAHTNVIQQFLVRAIKF